MILRGDARYLPLADESVQTVITSPPYWGLRDYQLGDKGIGLESTPDQYIAQMVAVFREVRRVLKPSGTVFLNLGDSYTSGGRATYRSGVSDNKGHLIQDDMQRPRTPTGLKPKDLMMMPARVALALQADGWWLRSDIVWAKPNPMPESVTDRPTRSHEYIFLLAKNSSYFYDATAIMESSTGGAHARGNGLTPKSHEPGRGIKANLSFHGSVNELVSSRNKRSVWTINSEPTPEAHFATFPQALVLPCILAGTSARGECARCGRNWERVTESHSHQAQATWNGAGRANGCPAGGGHVGRTGQWSSASNTRGWRPTCACDAPTRPNLVLDPFGGSSTVGVVAERLGRRWVTTELSWDYCQIGKRRTSQRGLFVNL